MRVRRRKENKVHIQPEGQKERGKVADIDDEQRC